MSVNKIGILILFLISSLCFSQNKDVYFLLDKNNPIYVVPGLFDNKLDYINLTIRKEYEYHEKKVKEAKKNGTYSYDKESGRDNLNISVPTMEFRILSKERIVLDKCQLQKLRWVDFDWLESESWKPLAGKESDFKNIHFLNKLDNDIYMSYKVGRTITVP